MLMSPADASGAVPSDGGLVASSAVLLVAAESPVRMAAKISVRSFQLQPCFARSLTSFSRAFSASLAAGQPIMACNCAIRRQTLRGGRVIGHPHMTWNSTHQHTHAESKG